MKVIEPRLRYDDDGNPYVVWERECETTTDATELTVQIDADGMVVR